MASALGTVTLVTKDVKAPDQVTFLDRITVVGDAAYPTSGTTGLLAAFRTAVGRPAAKILCVVDATATGIRSKYDVTNDKLMHFGVNGAEEGAGNLSGNTYTLIVLSA